MTHPRSTGTSVHKTNSSCWLTYYVSSPRRTVSHKRRTMTYPRRTVSPKRRTMTYPRRTVSPSRCTTTYPRRTVSPRRRTMTYPRRTVSPKRRTTSTTSPVHQCQVVTLLLLGVISAASGFVNEGPPMCGQPGRPINGTISDGDEGSQPGTGPPVPSGPPPVYRAGHQVTYSCVEGFVLFGDQHRTCLGNGSWGGEVPLCDFNVGAGKRSLQSGTLWSYSPGLAVDGSPDTCSFTPREPDPRWWQVHLGHKFNVIRVAVTISPGSLQEFTIYVIELLADNKALYKPCTTFKGVFQTHKAVFLCNDGRGHPGQFVYIRDDRKEEEYFGLCEVEVFAFRERIPCGGPPIPIHGRVVVEEAEGEREERARYSCGRGYLLIGDHTLTCSPRGKWEGHEPRCTEIRCPDLPSPPNGGVSLEAPQSTTTTPAAGDLVDVSTTTIDEDDDEVESSTSAGDVANTDSPTTSSETPEVVDGGVPGSPGGVGVVPSNPGGVGGVARYRCSPGYTLHGNTTRVCLPTGRWGGQTPVCARINCGLPPTLLNARYTLLNSSAVYHGIAVYTCLQGYRLSNASSEMVSTCLDTGIWRPINITCLPVAIGLWDSDGIARRTGATGRSLNYENPDHKLRGSNHNHHFSSGSSSSSGSGNYYNPDSNQLLDSDNSVHSLQNDNNKVESPLVMGLAIIASLLLVALVVLLSVMAIRRRYSLGNPGSLNPLIRSQDPQNHKQKYSSNYDPTYYSNTALPNVREDGNYNGGSMNNGNRTPQISSLYQHNIMSSLSGNSPDVTAEVIIQDNASLSGSVNRLDEPPYERVGGTRSEHSYETIRKLNQRGVVADDNDEDKLCYQQEPSYERVAGDKGSLWYESVGKGSVGYETVPGDRLMVEKSNIEELSYYQIQERDRCSECKKLDDKIVPCSLHKFKDPGYEKIREKDHQYETLKEKEAAYETLKEKDADYETLPNKNDPGYETMPKNTNILTHGYETVKPKLSETTQLEDAGNTSESSSTVPNILQDIEVAEVDTDTSLVEPVPPEILALYAQVDKTKKKKKVLNGSSEQPKKDSINLSSNNSSSTDHYSEVNTNNTRPTPPPRPKGMAPQPLKLHQPPASPFPSRQTQSLHPIIHHTQSDSTLRSSLRDSATKNKGDSSKGPPDLQNRFVKMASEELLNRPPSAASDYASPSGTLRPLPPIPKQ